MIECKEFEVDGKRYRTTMFGALRGSKLLLKISRIVAPAVGRAVGVVDLDMALSADVGTGMSTLFEAADPDTVMSIVKEFVEKSELRKEDGNWITLEQVFDDHFAGRYTQMVLFVKGAFEVNYGDFSGALRAMIAQALPGVQMKRATTPAPSASPSAST